jgi:hypothetical protein
LCVAYGSRALNKLCVLFLVIYDIALILRKAPKARSQRICFSPRLARTWGAPSLAKPTVGSENPNPCCPRIARVSSLLSGSTNRDPLNRPWSVAEYTFGDAIRRHEAQYAARAAAALAAASNRALRAVPHGTAPPAPPNTRKTSRCSNTAANTGPPISGNRSPNARTSSHTSTNKPPTTSPEE